MTSQPITDDELAQIREDYRGVDEDDSVSRLLNEVDRLRKILGYVEVPEDEAEENDRERLQTMLRTRTAQRDRLETNANTVRELHQPIETSDGSLHCRLCGDIWHPCRTTKAINGEWGARSD